MWVYLEPLIGWIIAAIGATLVAISVMFGKRFAAWVGKTIGAGVVKELRGYWKTDIDSGLAPIYDELQIGDGSHKWPNGSDTLPSTMKTIYDRQAETHQMVINLVGQLETFLTGQSTARPDDPDEVGGHPA